MLEQQSGADPARLAAAESTIAELTAELARAKRVEQLLVKKKKKLEEACSDADAVEAQLREEATQWMLKCEDAERLLDVDRQKVHLLTQQCEQHRAELFESARRFSALETQLRTTEASKNKLCVENLLIRNDFLQDHRSAR